jgi:nitroreductase
MPGIVNGTDLLDALNWRYAVKKFDPTKKIAPADWTTLEEAVRLSASSYGLQPWKFIVVTDPAVREKLKPAAWNQSQITDASHLVVFTYKTDITEADVDHFVQVTAAERGMPAEKLAGYRDMMVGDLVKGPRHGTIATWASRQVYIALGTLLTSAAALGIDACPMEGFVPDQFDEILGLKSRGLASVVLTTLGYRAGDDHYAALKKVRFPASEVIERV